MNRYDSSLSLFTQYLIKIKIMKTNVGSIDKIIRLLIAALGILLYFTHTITGTLGIVVLVIAVLMAVTSLVGFCPLYPILKINTTRKKN